MQFPVPKNIDLEDKIIGPLTLKQFLYLLVGGGLAYGIVQRVGGPGGNTQLAFLIAAPIALLALALAFVKIQERSFGDFLASCFNFLLRPRQRIWQKHEPGQDLIVQEQKKKVEDKVIKKSFSVQDVSDLTNAIDTPGGEKDTSTEQENK